MKSKHEGQLAPLPTLVLLLAVFVPLVKLVAHYHYILPAPVHDGFTSTGLPQFSESLARSHIQALEDVGYRIVGTPEHAHGRDYVLAEVERLAQVCKGVEGLECEVEMQRGSGSHRFNILDHDVLKTYSGLTNVLLRISNGTAEAKENALMLNAHIDSQLPGKGAADDAIGVGIMLELARVLIDRKQPFQNSILFLFNNAEESLQDASHLFSTQHPWASSVKSFINLEAAGTTGAEMLFQSASSLMLRAYAHVPYPHGTVLAADVFSSGIIGSDTDFGQFEEYLKVAGLDMALVDNSWYYHTARDVLDNLQKGSTQHFGENVLAIVDVLLGPESELASIDTTEPLEQEYVYFSLFDKLFVMYTLETARKISIVIFAALAILVLNRSEWRAWKAYLLALAGGLASFVGGLVSVNVVGIVMWKGFDSSMSWFSSELLPLGLYAPPCFLGMLLPQYSLSRFVSPVDRPTLEHATFTASTVILAGLLTLTTQLEVKSGFMLALLTSSGVLGMAVSEVLGMLGKRARGEVHLAGYITAQVLPTILGTITSITVLAIFVPLTGRMGVDVPVEHIIASITAILCLFYTPIVLPLFHRLERGLQRTVLALLIGGTLLSVVVYSQKVVFTATAPRRGFFQSEYNVTSNSFRMHLAQMDTASRAPELFEQIHGLIDPSRSSPMIHTDRSQDSLPQAWDSFNPVQAFFETFHFDVERPQESGKLPVAQITTVRSEYDAATDVREVEIRVDHPGLIWPVLTFDAEIVAWPFNTPPPAEHTRHHLKGVSEIGYESYSLAISVKGNAPIHLEWIGLVADGMWPASAPARGLDLPGTSRLRDIARFLETYEGGSVDGLLLSTVVGVTQV